MKATEMETKVWHLRQKCMRAGGFVEYFDCSEITQSVLSFCYHGGMQVMGNMCSD